MTDASSFGGPRAATKPIAAIKPGVRGGRRPGSKVRRTHLMQVKVAKSVNG